ncbi:universal stress protein family domain containing protein [Grosmannia clavigera kw1407]|uniref:Universal stress protein family domain containing protein n=1 Tax=Grosmannia clavigera (strain kw1407 / UAMH 11150) TaxID=655863 RepID=F0XBX4_GROCL|nr:universal stress protein family domain containing protein [Grosmannia clavigera kw1407]EFX04140.1 universal stress protein family domain containing protein [Grosmannia clavigera kw1407]
MSHKPMSIEAVMDEERREVLALLGKRSDQNRRSSSVASAQRSVTSRSGSPFTPGVRSPMRSMLDFGDDSPETTPPTTSKAANRGSPRVQTRTIRSMLDVDSSPALSPIKQVFSAQNSPTEAKHRMQLGGSLSNHPRSMSDVSSKPANFGPRSSHARGVNPSADYQFSDIITSRDTPAFIPRRAMQNVGANSATAAAKRNSSVAEIIRNADLSGLMLPGSQNPLHGRPQPSTRGSTAKSKSPHGRLNPRSKSPGAALSARTLSPAGRALLAETQLDMQNAYRRLSDANLIRSGGSLSELPRRKHSDGNDIGNGRLTKDYLSPDGDELADTSDEEEAYSSEDDEGRGRKTARSFPDELPCSASAAGKDGRQPLSLLAAAEEERIQVSQNYQYRSLFDEPEITVTNPSGEKVKTAKAGVHPANSFDVPSRSASRTPWDSDDEAEYTDIKSAQKLAFTMTPIMSTPDVPRSVRIIYRGDFVKIQKEVTEEEHRRLRKYLVATDLSEESTHALEWAVGTVVRDGDTLVAIYCVDEETGIPPADGPGEPKSAREQAASSSTPSVPSKLSGMTSLSTLATMAGSSPGLSGGTPMSSRPSLLTKNSDSSTTISSPVERTKAEEERERAVQDITNRITRLLRKTRLQVRVIVEVLHCKTPRHTLTEVIDILSPTLVILGSRGRSALKGRPPVNQVNNLNNPTARSLANAKID